MSQQEEESVEDYLEILFYSLHKSKQNAVNPYTICTISLKEIRNEYIDALNLMGACDISYLPFTQTPKLCRKYSKGS